jgi:hypothetical protein
MSARNKSQGMALSMQRDRDSHLLSFEEAIMLRDSRVWRRKWREAALSKDH